MGFCYWFVVLFCGREGGRERERREKKEEREKKEKRFLELNQTQIQKTKTKTKTKTKIGKCGSETWAAISGPTLASANVDMFDSKGINYILSTGGAAGLFFCLF